MSSTTVSLPTLEMNAKIDQQFGEQRGLTFSELIHIQKSLWKRSKKDKSIKKIAKDAEELVESEFESASE